ncbi:DEKNAAC105137 [Brettanomyces naardenensis]|uniref:DEKNAAC105137 n=1 Tax=Brettanomyces naardenensis TaxID=13370 RepID=A0A448YT09_BRENA|nr:DEKNAAC105137 [Brettanomyces naardenensis]
MSYSSQRQANISNFNPQRILAYESDSMKAILLGVTKSILQHESSDRQTLFKTEHLGDYTLPDYGLEHYLPPPSISPIFHRKGLKIMDFACGTGLLVQDLAPYLTDATVIGIDISDSPLAAFSSKLDGISKVNPSLVVKPYRYDIIDEQFNSENGLQRPPELVYGTFDLITTTLSFHHFSELDKIVAELYKYLKKDGKLIIVDMYDHKDEYAPDEVDRNSAVAHHGGFSPDQMKQKLAPFEFASVEVSEKYVYEHWCSEDNLMNHLPKPRAIKALKDAPRRERGGRVEYLVTRSLVMAIGRK